MTNLLWILLSQLPNLKRATFRYWIRKIDLFAQKVVLVFTNLYQFSLYMGIAFLHIWECVLQLFSAYVTPLWSTFGWEHVAESAGRVTPVLCCAVSIMLKLDHKFLSTNCGILKTLVRLQHIFGWKLTCWIFMLLLPLLLWQFQKVSQL